MKKKTVSGDSPPKSKAKKKQRSCGDKGVPKSEFGNEGEDAHRATLQGAKKAAKKRVRKRANLIPAKRRRKVNRPHGEAEGRALLQLRAFELRARRYTYREIAAELQINVESAHRLVCEYWQTVESRIGEEADVVRAMELAGLDEVERRWMPLAVHPALRVESLRVGADGTGEVIAMEAYDAGLKAVDRVLKVKEARAKLLGLYAPEKHEHKVEPGLTLEEFRARMAEAQR